MERSRFPAPPVRRFATGLSSAREDRPVPLNLFPWQKAGVLQAVRAIKEHGGAYLEHDPGLGKTLSALVIARGLKVERVAVVTQKVGLYVWRNQIKQWWPAAGGAIITRKGTLECWPGLPYFLITNYDQIRGDDAALRRLLAQFPQLVIADEGQNLKSPSSLQNKAGRKLMAAAPYRLFLSGTPAHSPLDWHQQYRMLAPADPYWNRTYTTYKEEIAIPHPYIRGAIQGFRPNRVAAAQAARVPYTHVARSEEMNVPEPIVTEVPFDLDPKEEKIYRQMERDLFATLGPSEGADHYEQTTSAAIALTKFLRLHQITGGFVTGDDGSTVCIGTSKLNACLELLEQRADQKVIVACRFRAELSALQTVLARQGRPFGMITGDSSAEDRSKVEHWFQDVKEPMVLLLQYKAGGVSLTLTAARALIIFSLEPSVIAFRQMTGRVYRIGQQTNVTILPLLARNSIDEKLFRGLQLGLDAVDLLAYLRGKR